MLDPKELEILPEMHVKMAQIDCPVRRAEGGPFYMHF